MGKFKEDLGLALELAGHADVVTMHRFEASDPVSYTHLTLPTILRV